MFYPNTMSLLGALRNEGIELPDECFEIRVTTELDSTFQIHYSCNLTGEKLVKVGRALTTIGSRNVEGNRQ